MSRLPRVPGRDVIRALAKKGYVVSRIRGSHHVLSHEDGTTIVVPVHGAETLGPGLLRDILNEAEISVAEFIDLL